MKADKHVASIGIWEENMVQRSIYSSDKSDCHRGKKQMLAANYFWGENVLLLERQNSFLFSVGKSSGQHVNMWKTAWTRNYFQLSPRQAQPDFHIPQDSCQ